jgi:hypothetical protein
MPGGFAGQSPRAGALTADRSLGPNLSSLKLFTPSFIFTRSDYATLYRQVPRRRVCFRLSSVVVESGQLSCPISQKPLYANKILSYRAWRLTMLELGIYLLTAKLGSGPGTKYWVGDWVCDSKGRDCTMFITALIGQRTKKSSTFGLGEDFVSRISKRTPSAARIRIHGLDISRYCRRVTPAPWESGLSTILCDLALPGLTRLGGMAFLF